MTSIQQNVEWKRLWKGRPGSLARGWLLFTLSYQTPFLGSETKKLLSAAADVHGVAKEVAEGSWKNRASPRRSRGRGTVLLDTKRPMWGPQMFSPQGRF